jgi:transcriptional regulator with XRE-family HTH domain
MKNKKSPHAVDIHVGRRVKTRRVLRNMSQAALADQLGLTFQQLRKYESGANRISAGRLWQIGQRLDVPATWFFEGLDGQSETLTSTGSNEALETALIIQSLPTDIRKLVQGLLSTLAKHMDVENT